MDYQEQYNKILQEKEKLEVEFAQSRGRFKEIYVECENLLHNEKENSRQLEIQVKELTRQIDLLKGENEGIRIAANISEEANQEEYASLMAKHQEEIASLQHIWKEASHEHQNKLVNDFRVERDKLLEANAKLEQKIRQFEDGNKGNNDGLVSMMTSALSSKKHPNSKGIDESPLSLENTQQQVQHDIDAWKSVVQSLELEINSLTTQLAESKSLVKKQDAKYSLKSTSDKEFLLNEELKETQKYFESEKSARTDLEMYVAVLNTQKSVLQEDSDKLKAELHNVCRLFEQEKMSHNELKMTWKLANEQFLAQQNNIIHELERTRKLLTLKQLEQLSSNPIDTSSNSVNKASDHAQNPFTAESLGQQHEEVKSNNNLIDFDSSSSSPSLKQSLEVNKNVHKKRESNYDKSGNDKLSDSLFNTFFPAAYQARQFNEMLLDSTKVEERPLNLSSSSEGEDDDIVKAIRIQNLNRYGVEEAEEVHESNQESINIHIPNAFTNSGACLENNDNETNISKKSSSSDNIASPISIPKNSLQEKSLSQGDLSFTKTDYHIDEIDQNDSIWNTVSTEYAHTCMMCQNYEKQLQRLQKDYMTITEKDNILTEKLKSSQLELNSEKENYAIMEKAIDNAVVDSKCKLKIYETNQHEVDKQVNLLQTQFQQFQNDILCEMRSLSYAQTDEHK